MSWAGLPRRSTRMLDELQRSLGAQRQLVMDASHELRTPLASLRTNVEVLSDLDRLSPAQRQATLSGIVSQLEELTGLVADVVELARGEAPPNLYDELSLDDLVERAVERARRHWPGITFHATTEPVQVRGVATRLDRAVANMLDNAGKFSPPGSLVDVRLTEERHADRCRPRAWGARPSRCRSCSTGSTGPTRLVRCPAPGSGSPSSSRWSTSTAAPSSWTTARAGEPSRR